VSAETRRDVSLVLERAERLPQMEHKLDWIVGALGAIDLKMDSLKAFLAREMEQVKQAVARTDAQAPPPAEEWSKVFKLKAFSDDEWRARRGNPKKTDAVLRATLGAGAFGTTLRVELQAGAAHAGAPPGTLFAAKWIEEETLINAGLDTAMVLREVEVLTMLRHPHIARFFRSYTVGEAPFREFYLVMELVAHGSLADHAVPPGVPPPQLHAWMLQLASAVVYIHELRVFHRYQPLNPKP